MSSTKPCRACGTQLLVSKSSAAEPMCHPCRAKRQARRRCAWCADHIGKRRNVRTTGPFFCSRLCFGRYQGDRQRCRDINDHRSQRWQRDSEARGITTMHRNELLRRWKRQRRCCVYCDEPADTIDHVIPLVRGGDNYEGNLVPCCRRCNSSKAARLIIEWRTGRRANDWTRRPTAQAGRRTAEPDPQPKPTPVPAKRTTKAALNLVMCNGCRETFVRARHSRLDACVACRRAAA